MPSPLKLVILAAFLGAVACTDDARVPEEPVEMSPEPPLIDEPAGTMDDMDGDAGGAAADGQMNSAAPEATEEMPMNEPAAPAQQNGTGGIISSGTKLSPRDKCKALESPSERQACLKHLKKK